MRILLLSFAIVLLAMPHQGRAEDLETPPSMMERGAQQFLEGLLLEMEPALEGMMAFIEEMGPAMRELLDEVQDWSVYEAPEVLPNGDIIIRRKPDEPLPQPQPQIDL